MPKKILIIISLVLIVSLISLFICFKAVVVRGSAMEPSFRDGDRYLANKITYLISLPQRGDVATFRYSQNPDFKGFSRIIGLPEEKLMIKDGKVYINGSILEEIYLSNTTNTTTKDLGQIKQLNDTQAKFEKVQGQKIFEDGQEIVIPANNYFMMGDDREKSIDSRSLGFVDKKDIEAKIGIKY